MSNGDWIVEGGPARWRSSGDYYDVGVLAVTEVPEPSTGGTG